jgi:mevalonate kinase
MSPAKISQTFYASAKLMITGEYLVLRGAKALSIPLKFGQTLRVSEHPGNPSLSWKTYIRGQHWFDAVFSLDEFVIGNSNDFPTAQNLRELLIAAKSLKSGFLQKKIKYEVVSELDFDINWGLGSSSSLIANIAQWAGIEPFDLFRKVSTGSGYDLATALSQKPIVFRLNGGIPEIKEVDFHPVFHNQLYFAYLGKKRNSAQAVSNFNNTADSDLSPKVRDIDAITDAILQTTDLRDFRKLIRDHEKLISGITGLTPLGYKAFSDFNGDLKSLGAWGGDFILLATDMPREYVASWLKKKDMNTWFGYEDIAL